jgi:energy-coupling factor transport system permease protein
MARRPDDLRLPRALHPGAWWLWALGMATAASRTTNPFLLALILAVVAYVVSARRSDAPWARGFQAYVIAGIVVIAIRVGFRILLGGRYGSHVLFTLPELPLPDAAAGIRLGGPVTLEAILAAFYDGLRLATLLLCVGSANLLANPKRLLKSMPGALHEMGVAVTVALTFAPQIIESGHRVRRARRLRGGSSRRRQVIRTVVVPVLTDALDRSLALAAAMDSRGYGRVAGVPLRTRATSGALLLGGLVGACVGTYGLLDSTVPRALGLPMLGLGVAAAVAGLSLAGRRIRRTVYRPDPWAIDEWAVSACGIAAATALIVVGHVDPSDLHPSLFPLEWPSLSLAPVLGILIGVLPAWLAPPVQHVVMAAPAAPRTASPVDEPVEVAG